MENEIIKLVASQGVFAIFFAYLLFYVLKENSKREGKYQEIISDLTQRFNILDDVKKSVDKIEEKLER
ncbi:BhlA/UviB family holin-like peptide [Clostridium botulinum]|uniref:BhlA/UviB family holin-like peptide n=1 Tax=Clostridium botulinum TaxID=1491 RepID=UPI0005F9441E|nr:BhlA/UviB family holin-like peptide [Clostridium botulinum]KEI92225.1 bacteriocin [Clostridium botulinum B2 275]MBY6800108.1 bacteriocin [Clostridium botulinum]NFF20664.1 bacteriocin [Clostridium botulinum]NFM74729.1 bacteriocin [Clostridium botulinum]NFP79350.1 bacteriocin [Clostridium botulinum]